MITSTTKTIAAAFAVAAALGATTAQAAPAKHGDGIRVGTCSDNSTSKLKVKRDNGRLHVEFDVDQNRGAVPWTVELRKDGRVVFSGTRLTSAPSGSFSLDRSIAGAKGIIKARATRNGETCTAVMQPGQILVSTTPAATPATGAVSDDGPAHDVTDDNGTHVADPAAHDVTDDNGGQHGNDD